MVMDKVQTDAHLINVPIQSKQFTSAGTDIEAPNTYEEG
jgi:hypothetical protein